MNKQPSLTTLMPFVSFVCIILLQSATNTISNFPAYSAQLINLLSISSLQQNSLIVASELGKFFDCVSVVAAEHLPLWLMLTIGMVLGCVAYVVQFLFLVNKIAYLSYWHLLVLHVLAGNSISWFNTVCSHAAERNFLVDHQTVIALASTYSGLSGKLYTLLVEVVHGPGARNASTYLILNCIVPVGVGLFFLLIVRDPPKDPIKSVERGSFSVVFMIAAVVMGYAVYDSVAPAIQKVSPKWRLVILLVLVVLPIVVPIGVVLERFKLKKWQTGVMPQASNNDDTNVEKTSDQTIINIDQEEENKDKKEDRACDEMEEEHDNELGVKNLLLNINFWLYFWVYACGATLTMAYFNNLGRISNSRAQADAPFLLAISSSFSFFGRLFTVTFDWFTRGKNLLARPATMAILMILMTVSFFILLDASNHYLYVSTAILGVCAGILATITGTITSDLFGPKKSAINHRILLANVPVGVLIYGSLAAIIYDREGDGYQCLGFKCFHTTFIIWGSVCSVGTILSIILYLRTRKFYSQTLSN